MAPRSSSRRLSLDLIHRAVSDASTEGSGIFKYMDLRLPSHAGANDVSEVQCECCGLSEDCTRAYVRCVRDQFCGRWVCGLCSEAVKAELERLGLASQIIREEAIRAHMEVCKKFHRTLRSDPAMSLADAMLEILKKRSKRIGDGVGSKRGANKVVRSCSAIPSHAA